jgi:hypothetical protein
MSIDDEIQELLDGAQLRLSEHFRTTLTPEDVQSLLDQARSSEEWIKILNWAGPPARRVREIRKKRASPLDKRARLFGDYEETLHVIKRGHEVAHIRCWAKKGHGWLIRAGSCYHRRPKKYEPDDPWLRKTFLNRTSRRRVGWKSAAPGDAKKKKK